MAKKLEFWTTLATVLVAFGTIYLAYVTRDLAKKTCMEAAETRKATVRPYLHVTRAWIGPPVGSETEGILIVMRFRNVGGGPALSVRGQVLGGNPISHGFRPINDARRVIPPGSFTRESSYDVLAGPIDTTASEGSTILVALQYKDINDEWAMTVASLKLDFPRSWLRKNIARENGKMRDEVTVLDQDEQFVREEQGRSRTISDSSGSRPTFVVGNERISQFRSYGDGVVDERGAYGISLDGNRLVYTSSKRSPLHDVDDDLERAGSKIEADA